MKRHSSIIRERSVRLSRAVSSQDRGAVSHRALYYAAGFSALLFMVSIIGYLAMVNRNAVSGYAIRRAEQRVAEVSEESKKLRIREAELRSLSSIEEASVRLNLVPADHIVSLRSPGPVAFR